MTSTPAETTPLIRQGWISLAVWIAFGILIEGFIGFRTPALLDDPVRRDLFRLAHAHGTLLSLVLIVAAICARLELIAIGRGASICLRLAGLFLPLGFLLSGIWHYKDDPGIAIVLAPIGAVLLLGTAIHFVWSASRRTS